jgi:hypothetical protein
LKIKYLTKPQALNIEPFEGLERVDSVRFVLEKLMSLTLKEIAYVDDMLVSALPFIEKGVRVIMAPSNAEESLKRLVLEKGGFVSTKRSTEAVAEFLTEIYPNQYQSNHSVIHSIYFDMDGILWERERFDEIYPFLNVIANYIKNCKGPYTSHPPISIVTGAYKESLNQALNYIPLNKQSIPAQFHRDKPPFVWPPIIFEEGYFVYDPITETTFDLTEEKYGLVSPVYQELIVLLRKLGEKINKRVPTINKKLRAECKIAPKEKGGYNLDLPLEIRRDLREVRKAHILIYRHIEDLLQELTQKGIKIEFGGLLSQNELEGRAEAD